MKVWINGSIHEVAEPTNQLIAMTLPKICKVVTNRDNASLNINYKLDMLTNYYIHFYGRR